MPHSIPKKRRVPGSRLTEMDLTVLAVIAQKGPLSAYDIRKEFAGSLTPTWSSSTGSVYPSCRRLITARLVTESAPAGGRSRRRVKVTAAGRQTLVSWLTRVTPEIAAATPDPIRTRMYFLDVLDADRRAQLIDDCIQSTKASVAAAIEQLNARAELRSDEWEESAAQGVLYELRARLQWLRWLAQRDSRK